MVSYSSLLHNILTTTKGMLTDKLRLLVSQALAHEVACYLGLDLGGIKIKRFADGEIYVQVQVSLRGHATSAQRMWQLLVTCCLLCLSLSERW